MIARTLTISAAALAAFILSAPVQARFLCPPDAISHEGLLQKWSDMFGESPTARAVLGSGNVIELLETPAGPGFTLVIVMPSGQACVLLAGEAWQAVRAKAKPIGLAL